MPVFCAAYGCNNRRSFESRSRGITFHKFPSDTGLRRKWEVAIRRKGFVATESSKLCSEHFRPADFDRTGQIVRLRHGATPSVLSVPSHLQRSVAARNTKTSRRAEETQPVDLSQRVPQTEPQQDDDHSYALPTSPARLKARLSGALARVESLEREKLIAKARERRARRAMKSLLKDLQKQSLINEQLKERLDLRSDGQTDLCSERGREDTKNQRALAVTLQLHGPDAHAHRPLPRPHTLQRWMQSVETRPELMLDMMQRRREEDPPKHDSVALVLDEILSLNIQKTKTKSKNKNMKKFLC